MGCKDGYTRDCTPEGGWDASASRRWLVKRRVAPVARGRQARTHHAHTAPSCKSGRWEVRIRQACAPHLSSRGGPPTALQRRHSVCRVLPTPTQRIAPYSGSACHRGCSGCWGVVHRLCHQLAPFGRLPLPLCNLFTHGAEREVSARSNFIAGRKEKMLLKVSDTSLRIV